MIERERWIVYPLLFLALGMSLKDKFVAPEDLDASHIVCQDLKVRQLVLTDDRDHPLAQLRPVLPKTNESASPGGVLSGNIGEVELLDAKGHRRALLGPLMAAERIETAGLVVIDSQHKPRVEIGTLVARPKEGPPKLESCGVIQVYGPSDMPILFLGSRDLGKHGEIEVSTEAGLPLVILGASPQGGILLARHGERQAAIAVGNFPEGSGVVAQVGKKEAWMAQLPKKEIDQLPKVEPQEREKPPSTGKPPRKAEPKETNGKPNGKKPDAPTKTKVKPEEHKAQDN
ncbi:MAG: hypothetical protein K8T25_23850 [Planctomycetia bacterium]|nr:hypothetical protein [Planctomycetia bacterium]